MDEQDCGNNNCSARIHAGGLNNRRRSHMENCKYKHHCRQAVVQKKLKAGYFREDASTSYKVFLQMNQGFLQCRADFLNTFAKPVDFFLSTVMAFVIYNINRIILSDGRYIFVKYRYEIIFHFIFDFL